MSTKATCPKCHREIPLDDVNVSTDVALCRQCGQTWEFSQLIEDKEITDFDLRTPPPGAWYREMPPRQFEVGATTRSAAAFFLVPFMCVWSGFSLGGIYGSQIAKHQFNLVFSLFGIPFLLGTLFFGSIAVMTVCGKVVVRVDGDKGEVFTGVGPIGWRRRFSWYDVSEIRQTERYGSKGGVTRQITLGGAKRLNFGSGVKGERLDFMIGALRKKWREFGHAQTSR